MYVKYRIEPKQVNELKHHDTAIITGSDKKYAIYFSVSEKAEQDSWYCGYTEEEYANLLLEPIALSVPNKTGSTKLFRSIEQAWQYIEACNFTFIRTVQLHRQKLIEGEQHLAQFVKS